VCSVKTALVTYCSAKQAGRLFVRLFNIIDFIRQRERGKGGLAQAYFDALIKPIMLLSLGVCKTTALSDWRGP